MRSSDDPVVVLGYARAPVGSFGKSLATVPAHVLGATAARRPPRRPPWSAPVSPPTRSASGSSGAWAPPAATPTSRRVALEAGAAITSTAMTVNRLCGGGHPIGATGAIISARTIENLRGNQRELGLATMCIGGGQAEASLWRAL